MKADPKSNGAACTQLAIVESAALVREGLIQLFSRIADVSCSIVTSDSAEAAAGAERGNVDVVLLGPSRFPFTDWISSIKVWRERHPALPIMILDDEVRDGHVMGGLQLGVAGYFTCRDTFSDLVDGVRECARGGRAFTKVVLHRLSVERDSWMLTPLGDRPCLYSLTNREKEVLCKLAQGLTAIQCSQLLGISPSTVDNHRARIMKKLRVRKTVDLTRIAVSEGLVPA